jgi:hypothetical protein
VKRTPFQPRKIRLVGEVQRETALAMLKNAPLDAERPLEVMLREEPKARGLDQNGLYWLRLGEIADQAWLDGRQFNSDTWHEYARRKLMPETVTTKSGEVRSKWIELPDGELTVISTTQLERRCFAEYTTIVEAFGAGLGVVYSVNPRERMAA